MKITVLNLDSPNMFLKTFRIRHMDRMDRLMGYCGQRLFTRAEREPTDTQEMVDAARQILARHEGDFMEAATFLFKIICKALNGTIKGEGDERTWTIRS